MQTNGISPFLRSWRETRQQEILFDACPTHHFGNIYKFFLSKNILYDG
jgi:hypothetical protein